MPGISRAGMQWAFRFGWRLQILQAPESAASRFPVPAVMRSRNDLALAPRRGQCLRRACLAPSCLCHGVQDKSQNSKTEGQKPTSINLSRRTPAFLPRKVSGTIGNLLLQQHVRVPSLHVPPQCRAARRADANHDFMTFNDFVTPHADANSSPRGVAPRQFVEGSSTTLP